MGKRDIINILQEDFKCDRPLDGEGKLTKDGFKAYSELTGLLYKIAEVSDCHSEVEEIIDTLDEQLHKQGYVDYND